MFTYRMFCVITWITVSINMIQTAPDDPNSYPKNGVLEKPLPDPSTPAPSIYVTSPPSSPDCSFKAEDDAQALMVDFNSGLIENFVIRTAVQRHEIISAYNKLNPNSPFYPTDYKLLTGDDMTELKFALSLGIPTDLILEYLHSSFEISPNYWWGPFIVEIMGIADMDKQKFFDQYKEKFRDDVQHGVDQQGNDYKNFLNEILKGKRSPDSTVFNDDDVREWVQALWAESFNWNDHRDFLDAFVLNSSKKFIRVTVPTFNAWYNQSLYDRIENGIFDHNLKIGYKYLVLYGVNYHEAVATRIYDSFNEPFSQIPTKIMSIVAFSESTLKDINAAFQTKYKQTIEQYLLSKSTDPVNQALAAMSKQAGGNSLQLGINLSSTIPPYPVSPTIVINTNIYG